MPHARGGLLPILSWNAKSIRKGSRIKQKQGAHDAVSSYLVSLSLPQNQWRSSRKMSGEKSGYWIIPRDQIHYHGILPSESTDLKHDQIDDRRTQPREATQTPLEPEAQSRRHSSSLASLAHVPGEDL